MALAHFCSSWRNVLRRVSFPTPHLAKPYGRCLNSVSSQRIYSRRVAGELDSENNAKSGHDDGRLSCRELHVEGMFSRERFRSRSMLAQWKSHLSSVFSGDKVLTQEGLERRWMHSDIIGPPWQWSVTKASSWNDILSVERVMRGRLNEQDYGDMVEACEVRLVELYREGVLFTGSLPFVVKKKCGEWQALSLAIGCACRLVGERDFAHLFSVEKMGEFIHAVQRHRGHENAGCERLQSLINSLSDPVKMRDASSRCLLNVLNSAAHMKCYGLSLHGLIVGVERLYMKRLHELPPEELVWLASASGRISNRERDYDCTALYDSLLEEFSGRWTDFSWHHCIQMLVNFAFSLPKGSFNRERMGQLLRGVDNHLAPYISALSSKDIGQLASVFTQFAYKAKYIPFRDVLCKRIESLKERELVSLFHYVSIYDVVDESLLRSLYSIIRQQARTFLEVSVKFLFTSLAFSGVGDVQGCGDCASVLVEDIDRRLSENAKPFSSEQSAQLVYALVRLSMDNTQGVGMLYSKAIGEFENLSMLAMSQFVFGVSKLKDNAKYVASLCDAIHRRDLHHEQLQLESAGMICAGLVELRCAHEQWLNEIIRFSSVNVAALMSEDLKGMAIVLYSLSYLSCSCTGLFQAVKSWLEGHAALVSQRGWCNEIINIVWACVAQDVLPWKTLAELRNCEPPSVEEMVCEELLNLHQVCIIAQKEAHLEILKPESYAALQEVVRRHEFPFPRDVWACVKGIAQLLPTGHVREDLFTPEGLKLEGALLKRGDGTTAQWPHHPGEEQSMAEVKRLVGSYQPLALLVLGQVWFDLSGKDLGPAMMKRKTLQACGWDVLVIPTSDYSRAPDKTSFLRSCLEDAGVKVPK